MLVSCPSRCPMAFNGEVAMQGTDPGRLRINKTKLLGVLFYYPVKKN